MASVPPAELEGDFFIFIQLVLLVIGVAATVAFCTCSVALANSCPSAHCPPLELLLSGTGTDSKMDLACEIVTSERGNKLLAVEGFKYYRSKVMQLTGEVKWRCTLRCCTARMYTKSSRGEGEEPGSKCGVVRMAGVHNHDPGSKPRDQDELVEERLPTDSLSSSDPESDKLTIDFEDEQVYTTISCLSKLLNANVY